MAFTDVRIVLADATPLSAVINVLAGTGIPVGVITEVPVKGELLPGDLVVGYRPLIGGEVAAGLAAKSLNADQRYTGARFTADGRQLGKLWCPPEDEGLTTPIILANDTSVHEFLPTRISPIKMYLLGVQVINLSATPNAIFFSDGVSNIGDAPAPALGAGVTATEFLTPLRSLAPATAPIGSIQYRLAVNGGGASTLRVTPHWFITRD